MRILLAVLALIAATVCPAADAAPKWAIVIHGGAGVIDRKELTPEQEAAYREALARAIGAGIDVLKREGSALDAVEATIVLMEDDPLFNAGRGAVFRRKAATSSTPRSWTAGRLPRARSPASPAPGIRSRSRVASWRSRRT